MNLKRGDVALARFPHAGGSRGKKRPVVVIQSDVYIGKLSASIMQRIDDCLKKVLAL
jgi:mRNA-degrading endonuclease toxin of MazEF toxin-antitoxin module